MTKRYKLRIPDGCKVESVSNEKVNGKDAIIVTLAPEFDPKPGDYVVTDDGQVEIKTKDGYFRFGGGANLSFTKYANNVQKEVFDELLKEAGLMYDRYSEDVIPLPKEGDFCIFWVRDDRKYAVIGIFGGYGDNGYPKTIAGCYWVNCIKFMCRKQFMKLINE